MFFSRVLSGYRAYKKVLTASGIPSGSMAYFIDYAGSGDTYLCCSYLACQQKITDHAVFVAAGALSGKIAALFGFNHLITLTRQQAFSLRIMGRFYGGKLKLYPLLYESEPLRYSGILRHMQGFRGLAFVPRLVWSMSKLSSGQFLCPMMWRVGTRRFRICSWKKGEPFCSRPMLDSTTPGESRWNCMSGWLRSCGSRGLSFVPTHAGRRKNPRFQVQHQYFCPTNIWRPFVSGRDISSAFGAGCAI